MKTYFAKTPRLIMRIFSKYTWRFSFNKKEVFLTFDDGPTPEITKFVLSELKKYEAKATFFCIGKNITKQPEIFQNIISDGHAIGNHTQNHLNGWRADDQEYINSVLDCENVISRTMKNTVNPKLFRLSGITFIELSNIIFKFFLSIFFIKFFIFPFITISPLFIIATSLHIDSASSK